MFPQNIKKHHSRGTQFLCVFFSSLSCLFVFIVIFFNSILLAIVGKSLKETSCRHLRLEAT